MPLEPVSDPDVRFERVPGNALSAPPEVRFQTRRNFSFVKWPDVGCFSLEAGRHVQVELVPDVVDASLRVILLGIVLSLVLYQRGFLVLHASAAAFRDAQGNWGAVGFLGRSGEGKSTMAATFHARGHRLICDDVIAVPIFSPDKMPFDSHFQPYSRLPTPDFPPIFPAYAQMRLWPQAVEALGQDASALPLLFPGEPKLARRVMQDFDTQQVPLRALCVLESGDNLELQRLTPATALVGMIRNTYCVGLRDPGEAAAQFQKCGVLAQTLPIFRLERPRDLSRLGDIAALIESQIATNWTPGLSKT